MRFARRLVALSVLPAALLDAQARPLTVLRHAPASPASASQVVTITFDRPVAGRLDETVPAERLLRVEPAIRGRVEWRDPVTIRLVPDAPLAPGTTYRVTVDTGFRAVDGSRLAEPYRFSFRVSGPSLLWRSFDDASLGGQATLAYGGAMLLLYSAPVDVAPLEREARIEVAECGGERPRRVPLRVVRQRAMRERPPAHAEEMYNPAVQGRSDGGRFGVTEGKP